ncbi:polysaccharide deacetylase family protein [Sphingomonas sp. QA11]|uniref:polysaccharide deacetylase family protein n=1 Tax=Sphingomonas sp. QA11 TaxID=2950605 RepID=UPI00234B2754|nr:polysaccharide deacetylase family protein [Sphingomonas sp. QA11]WCM25275.1 polysaccharide deacetylase family protein [Sphingomonas sp. QA11]
MKTARTSIVRPMQSCNTRAYRHSQTGQVSAMTSRIPALCWLIAIVLLAAPAEARTGRAKIALTFDDLPALTILNDQPYVNYLNDTILRGLKRHRIPATGFVNESKLDEIDRVQQIAVLGKWLDASMDLGNHTFSHESPNSLGAAGYIADIAKGEPVTRGLLAARNRRIGWFRHPYLETGTPEAVKHEIDDWLRAHGYRIAPVTIDADDWEFAEPYDDAIAHRDEARRKRIRSQYLDYTHKMIRWYRSAAHALFGRDIAYVMLLHATRLNADCIDDLAAMLRRENLQPVSLENAMRDPAYRTRDPYAGKDGIEWLERWSMALHKDLPWDSFTDIPKEIEADYDKVDRDR